MYVRDKIIVLSLNRYSLPPHIEISFFQSNLRNLKWLVCCFYNLHKNLIKEHLLVFTEGIQFNKSKQEEKKSRSERKVSKKQLIKESDDDDAIISNVGGNNSTDNLSELDDEIETGIIMIISVMLFILQLELISILL